MIHYTASSLFSLLDEAIAGLMPRLMLLSRRSYYSSSRYLFLNVRMNGDAWLSDRFVRRFYLPIP